MCGGFDANALNWRRCPAASSGSTDMSCLMPATVVDSVKAAVGLLLRQPAHIISIST